MSEELHDSGQDVRPKGGLATLLYILVGGIFLSIFGIMIYATLTRYFLNAPPAWGEEIPKVLFVWMVYLGAGLAAATGVNLRVTFFSDLLRPRTRAWLEVCLHSIVLMMLAVLAWYSIPVIELSSRNTLQATGWNLALVKIPLPIGCVIMAWFEWRHIRQALVRARG